MSIKSGNELSKTYDSKATESKWNAVWKKGGYFKPKKGKKEEAFTLLMPPPNVTGKLHMGHALNYVIQDTVVRHKRMSGYETLWIPGQDHAGISTQAVVEKDLWQEQKKTKHDLGREKFLERVWDWKEKNGNIIIEQMEKLGVSPDWDYFCFTMDEIPNKAVKRTFVDWYNQGLIYQADYIINWDPVLGSAISDAEVEHQEVKGAFYYIKYQIKDSEEFLTIATTRPETMLADTGVAVNSKDERFKHLIGKKAIIPIVNREVPIVGDDYVDITKGTGCLKVTPGHDFNDFEIGKRHNLKIINLLNPDGTLNHIAPNYQGMTCKDARKKLIDELTDLDLFIKEESCIHQVGHGQRSGEIVEPMVSKQWFVKTKDMAELALKSVEQADMKFFPKSWENTYFSWLKNPKDWCISRQLWWGHQIPVFYCDDCKHQWASTEDETSCPKCKSDKVTQDSDVLDTWFSSGLWPLSTLGWPDKKAMEEKGFDRFFPTTTLITAFDIIFFWVARMMMMSLNRTEQAPFKDTYIHAIVRDKYGRKMSKSLGNGIDPLEIIEQFGTDAVRFTLAGSSGHNRNINLDPAKIEGGRNFINKLWNAFRFIYPHLENIKGELPEELTLLDHHDRWIISELNTMIQVVNKSFKDYRFDDACASIYSFVYDKFCSWYIELSKNIIYGNDQERKNRRLSILKYVFRKVMTLLHPVVPFITEELWQFLKESNEDLLIIQEYPKVSSNHIFADEQEKMNKFIEIIKLVRNLRQSVNIAPKEMISVNLFIDSSDMKEYFQANLSYFSELAKIKELTFHLKSEIRPNKSLSGASSIAEVFIPLEGLIDIDDQIKRISKNLDKAQKEFQKLDKKLKNPNFKDKAPQEVFAEVEDKANELTEKISSLDKMLKNFQS